MKYIVFDIEADGLLDEVRQLHILGYYKNDEKKFKTITDTSEIKNFFKENKDYYFVGHNIVNYDFPVLEKLFNIRWKNLKIIDTLFLSFYLRNKEKKHNLDYYAKLYNTKKVQVEDWKNSEKDVYKNRVLKDVEINLILWQDQYRFLKQLYKKEEKLIKFLNYLYFKAYMVYHHRLAKIKWDIPRTKKYLNELEKLKLEKIEILKKAMPPNIKYVEKKRPKNIYKKDGSLSKKGEKWSEELRKRDLPPETDVYYDEIKEEPNPQSDKQLKDWLFSLGWEPDVYITRKNKSGKKTIPQIAVEGELTQSVKDLLDKEPNLKYLEQLGLINHRIGLLKAILEEVNSNGIDYEKFGGLTNTFRYKHRRPYANLPKPSKWFGKEIRSLIIAPEGKIMCGADLSGLEDTTKHHFMAYYDPEYVKMLRQPGFDGHIYLAVKVGILTEKEGRLLKELRKKEEKGTKLTKKEKEDLKRLNKERSKAKTVNFASLYGITAPTLSKNLNIPLDEAKKIIDGFWKENRALKQFIDDIPIKEVEGQLFVYNPLSKFWYPLRYLKDKFSTVNQSAGVYVFDNWLMELIKHGIWINFQYHDEEANYLRKQDKEKIKQLHYQAIKAVNKKLKPNVEFNISIAFGNNYAEVH